MERFPIRCPHPALRGRGFAPQRAAGARRLEPERESSPWLAGAGPRRKTAPPAVTGCRPGPPATSASAACIAADEARADGEAARAEAQAAADQARADAQATAAAAQDDAQAAANEARARGAALRSCGGDESRLCGSGAAVSCCDAGTQCADGVCVPGEDPGSDCVEGSDCDSGKGTCRSGVCQPKTCHAITPGTAECATNADCTAGEICQNGGCFIPCNPSVEGSCSQACTDCLCDAARDGDIAVCLDRDFGVGACDATFQCAPGSICSKLISGDNDPGWLCTRPCPVFA